MNGDYARNVATAAIAIIVCSEATKLLGKKKRKIPRWWVRSIFLEQTRNDHGDHNLLAEMRLNDHESFFNYTRMSPASFDSLLQIVGPTISRQDTNYRSSINPSTRLALTLRYLASGSSQRSLSYAFRVGKAPVCYIIKDTLTAIYECLRNEVLPLPSESDWLSIAEGFKIRWNFPNCIGATDGKHIETKAPPYSGSEYHNYKKFFSIILLAVCDYRYRFVMIDVGSQGRQSDGGVFKDSQIGKRLASNSINAPKDGEICEGGPVLPYFFFGDEAFGLKPYMITPYSGKSNGKLDYEKSIFNYRQSRARRVIENAFGILSARWRILRTCIETSTDSVDRIVQASVCLHNFCLREEENSLHYQKRYCPSSFVDQEITAQNEIRDGEWRRFGELFSISRQGSYNVASTAIDIRNTLAEHFITDGSVPWQWDFV